MNSKTLNYLYEENCRSRNIDSSSSKFLEFKTFIFSQPSAMSANVTFNLTFMHSIFKHEIPLVLVLIHLCQFVVVVIVVVVVVVLTVSLISCKIK